MATYVTRSMTDPLNVASEVRCDTHSRFDPEGFPLPLADEWMRSWTPVWGGPCEHPGCGIPT
jgi:hypothetical protein